MASDDLPVLTTPTPQSPPEDPTPVTMESRNALDTNGSIIGTVELPSGTSEDIWSERLALYTVPPIVPPTPDPLAAYKVEAQAAIDFGNSIIVEFGASNSAANLSTSQVGSIASKLMNVQLLLQGGALSSAIQAINAITPDDYLTSDVLKHYRNEIETFLGRTLT